MARRTHSGQSTVSEGQRQERNSERKDGQAGGRRGTWSGLLPLLRVRGSTGQLEQRTDGVPASSRLDPLSVPLTHLN